MTLILSGTDGLSDVDGSAATPAIRGTDANTGIFFPAADTVGVSTGGSERVRVNSSGNVGIGTSSPTSSLNLIDALSGGQLLVATNQTNATEKYGTFGTQHYTNAEEPALGVAVQSNVTDNNILIGGALGEFNAATQVRFYTAANNTTVTGTERMRIDSSGNVGIGTASPSTRLTVLSSTNQGIAVNDGTVNTILYNTGSANGSLGTTTNHPMAFYTNNTEQARITAAGLFQFNSGYGSVATAYGCRAWVNFNGTGTVAIRASGNVSSITDNNTGRYTVNFTTAMPNVNYSTVGTCNFEVDVGLPVNTNSNATGSVQVTSYRPYPYNAYVDVSTMSVAIFR